MATWYCSNKHENADTSYECKTCGQEYEPREFITAQRNERLKNFIQSDVNGLLPILIDKVFDNFTRVGKSLEPDYKRYCTEEVAEFGGSESDYLTTEQMLERIGNCH